jgi:hypothetical protein
MLTAVSLLARKEVVGEIRVPYVRTCPMRAASHSMNSGGDPARFLIVLVKAVRMIAVGIFESLMHFDLNRE